MTYPITQPADNAPPYTWTQPIRDAIGGVNDHQTRVTSLETLASNSHSANYTFVVGDVGVEQVYTGAGAGTFTVPSNATAAIAVGKSIPVRQSGAGLLSVAGAAGVTVNSRGGALNMAGQHAVAELRKTATDTWLFYGDIA